MSTQGIAQIVFYVVVLSVLGYPLGIYMSRVYKAETAPGRALARLRSSAASCARRVHRQRELRADVEGLRQDGARSSRSSSSPALYVLLRIQGHLFLNPDNMKGVAPRSR